MRKGGLIWLAVVLALAGPAAAAEEDKLQQGLDLLGEGTRLLLKGLADQLQPALDGLEGWLRDLDAYELPEVLPNGDIIIRRKTPPPPAPDAPGPGEVDL